ncbi:unnamed protein product [Paramecium octaurelia]|uniref:Uncharacterized protein n=1 Tax=Paramecium octaurelia TaxID=43137 RepID=A0A8S1XIV4_PAROT|nr:unnamed protein product [Paramecium octaurelia]
MMFMDQNMRNGLRQMRILMEEIFSSYLLENRGMELNKEDEIFNIKKQIDTFIKEQAEENTMKMDIRMVIELNCIRNKKMKLLPILANISWENTQEDSWIFLAYMRMNLLQKFHHNLIYNISSDSQFTKIQQYDFVFSIENQL